MRKRHSRKSRSLTGLDLSKLYVHGIITDIFAPIETPTPTETEFEVRFCESVLRTQESHFEAMVALGNAYTRIGEYQKGLELDQRLSSMCPENGKIHYNLACSYSLTGQLEKAFLSLTQAIDLGYDDLEHLRADHDLDALRVHPRFPELLGRVSKMQKAQAE